MLGTTAVDFCESASIGVARARLVGVMLLSRCLVAAACVGRAPPVYFSAADSLVTTLIDQLKTSADATETLAALEEVGGFDALPDGRWARCRSIYCPIASKYGTKL